MFILLINSMKLNLSSQILIIGNQKLLTSLRYSTQNFQSWICTTCFSEILMEPTSSRNLKRKPILSVEVCQTKFWKMLSFKTQDTSGRFSRLRGRFHDECHRQLSVITCCNTLKGRRERELGLFKEEFRFSKQTCLYSKTSCCFYGK